MPFNYQYVSPLTRKVNDTNGVLERRVVVSGTNRNEIKNPAAANAGNIEGVTLVGHTRVNGASCGVQKFGVAECIAAGAIAKDALVNIADTQGRVKAVNEAGGTLANLVGRAQTAATALGDVIEVELNLNEKYTL